MTAQQIDKIICDWSMKHAIALTEGALDDLVDTLEIEFQDALKETPQDE